MLGSEIVSRINQLGAISETPDNLTRIFLSSEHRTAADLLMSWMRDAGMAVHLDAIGNVCGRYEGDRPGLPCLMLGSHYDTVRDAGKWDGPLGVITAIACVADLNRRGVRRPFAIEVVGFADEEGVRFASTLLGSRAVAGTFDESLLDVQLDIGQQFAARARGGADMIGIEAEFRQRIAHRHAGSVPRAERAFVERAGDRTAAQQSGRETNPLLIGKARHLDRERQSLPAPVQIGDAGDRGEQSERAVPFAGVAHRVVMRAQHQARQAGPVAFVAAGDIADGIEMRGHAGLANPGQNEIGGDAVFGRQENTRQMLWRLGYGAETVDPADDLIAKRLMARST